MTAADRTFALRTRLAESDQLTKAIGFWLGLGGDAPSVDDRALIKTYRYVAIEAICFAVGRSTEARLREALEWLQSRRYFVPHSTPGLEADPLAIFAIAIGTNALSDMATMEWAESLAARAAEGEVLPERMALLRSAQLLTGTRSDSRTWRLGQVGASLRAKGFLTATASSSDGLPFDDQSGLLVPFTLAATALRPMRTTSEVKLENGDRAVDVGIVTMKEEEFAAMTEALAAWPRQVLRRERRDYDVFSVATQGQTPTQVAVIRTIQPGNAHAQAAAADLLEEVRARFIVVAGIAGGIPSLDFTLGDVVVSSYVHDLTLEDTGTSALSRRYNALGGPLHKEAARIVTRLSRIVDPRAWSTPVASQRPALSGEHTTAFLDWNKSIDEAFAAHRESQRLYPIVRAERVASSDRLVKDPDIVAGWRHVIKGVAAVEMESAGVYLLCQHRDVPFLAVRGLSDIIGWKRDEAWTLYACRTAAAFAAALLTSGALRPDTG